MDAHVRHGQDFGAVGLFVQWLTEQVNEAINGSARVTIVIALGYGGRRVVELLIIGSGTRTFKKQWNIEGLNELHRADNGRGGLLKEEIRITLAQIREQR